MVVEPEETSVVEQGRCYLDVDEQMAIVAVPDSNGSIKSGHCDTHGRIKGVVYSFEP